MHPIQPTLGVRLFRRSALIFAGMLCSFQPALGQFSQQGPKLVGTGASGFSRQGGPVALSADGNTAIVSGPNDSNGGGAVWVFTRSAGAWTQQGSKLVGASELLVSDQGASVALSADGNTAVVGSPGFTGGIFIFTRTGEVWTQEGSKLLGTATELGVSQGESVALSSDGNTAIEGGSDDNNGAGAAWVFTRSAGTWTQQGSKLVGTGAVGTSGARQGMAVGLSGDGNTAIVGGADDNGGIGAAWGLHAQRRGVDPAR
jgi:hypothetical protein